MWYRQLIVLLLCVIMALLPSLSAAEDDSTQVNVDSVLTIPVESLVVDSASVPSTEDSLQFTLPDSLTVRPKIGLVLSGGGAKGLAHIGVLRVLEEAGIHPDIITGTSMGAIVGSLYSIGYTPDEIDSIFTQVDWIEIFDDRIGRREKMMDQKEHDGKYQVALPFENWNVSLPTGVMYGQRITLMLAKLMWPVHDVTDFSQLPRPFCCVATDLETGEPHVFKNGFLVEAVRASMAIPSIFTPVKVEDKLLVDGMLARNIPAQDARELGADIIIAVDVGQPLKDATRIKTMVDVINQTMIYRGEFENRRQRKLVDFLIKPKVDDIMIMEFNRGTDLVSRGEEACRHRFTEFKKLAEDLDKIGEPPKFYRPISPDSVYVKDIEMKGISSTSRRQLQRYMQIELPGWITRNDIDKYIDRVYSTNRFELLNYQLKVEGNGCILALRAVEKTDDELNAGVHYDTDDNTAIQLNLTLNDLLVKSSIASAQVRLGDYSRFDASYWLRIGQTRSMGFRTKVHAIYGEDDYVAHSDYSVPYNVTGGGTEFLVGSLFSTSRLYGIGMEFSDRSFNAKNPPTIDNTDFDENISTFSIFGLFEKDTRNRLYYPNKGMYMKYKYAYGGGIDDETMLSYQEHILIGDFTLFPMFEWDTRLMIRSTVKSGNYRPIIPFYRIGGVDTFYGADYNSLGGSNINVLRFTATKEFHPRIFGTIGFDVARVSEFWSAADETEIWRSGSVISIGTLTPFGIIQISTVGYTESQESVLHIRLGFMF